MKIALLHTGQVHVDTFQALFDGEAAGVMLEHHVAPELLARAQASGLDAVRGDTLGILTDLAGADAVLCTCSTLGPLTDIAAGTHPHIVRIDQPLMQAACTHGPAALVAICLDSTREATLALLGNTANGLGVDIAPEVILCNKAWPLFETGQIAEFGSAVAAMIHARVAQGGIDCVVLAQASMRAAEPDLANLGLPVLSSPLLAVRRTLQVATVRGS